MLTAGEKTEQVTIVRDTITYGDDGSEIRTPGALAVRWASVKPLSAREWFAAQQTQSSASYRVRMDYMPTVKASDRLTWNGLTLQILGEPMHDRQGRETTLMCGAINA